MLKKNKLESKKWESNNSEKLRENNIPKRLTMCKKCYTFYYKNSWHFDKPVYLEIDQPEDIPVRFIECPACVEQELAYYEQEPVVAWRRV